MTKIDKNYEISYEGDLRVKMTHLKSGTTFYSDAPTDNNGKGESFSPTDLLVNALVSCVLTIIGIHFKKKDRNIKRINAGTKKVMYADPRRVGEVLIEFDFGENEFDERDLIAIKKIVESCPVTLSINTDIKIQTNL